MSKGKPKKTETIYDNALKTVQAPSQGEAQMGAYSSPILDYFTKGGKGAITDQPWMQPYVKTFQTANARSQKERMGGLFGGGLSGPGSEQHREMLRQLYANDRARELGGQIEDASNSALSNALGISGNTAQLANQRNLGSLNSATNLYGAQINKPSIWGSIIGGAAQVASNSKWLAASDARLKFSVKTNPYGLQEVLKLKPVWYIMDGSEQVGFIAQEVEEVMPELVVEIRDGLKGLMYGNMTSVLAKAVQELHAELESVKQQKKGGARKMLSSCLSWIRSIF